MELSDKLSKRLVEAQNGCWEFVGAKTGGYGVLNINGTVYRAHRLVWELEYGDIPNGLLVLHNCDNRSCCNPKHLFLGTHQDNSNDKYSKQRDSHTGEHCRGELNCNALLTEDDVRNIRKQIELGFTHAEIADSFNVSRYTITDINRGKTWNHVQ